MSLVRQHLIDPELCIRCNTCEERCSVHAITHNAVNYAVDAGICNWCGDCFPTCPTGAIHGVRIVARPWTIKEQFKWDSLPPASDLGEVSAAADLPAEVTEMIALAHEGEGGKAFPPASASKPYVNLYTPDKPIVATVTGNYRLTSEGAETDIRHIVLDFGAQPFPVLEGQSIGIRPPGADERGQPHHIRLYSVASPRDGERPGRNTVALTVRRVVIEENGTRKRGVGSSYVCDLERGDRVEITGPYGDTFLMPDDPGANLLMVCTGTGSAPFRAMTERRRRHHPDGAGRILLFFGVRTRGRILLFFGARTRGELPYFGPLMNLPKTLIDVELALSREKEHPKQHVQDRMRARADDVAKLLKSEKTHLYVCGRKGMGEGCEEVLREICTAHGLDWAAERDRMRREGRFHVETY